MKRTEELVNAAKEAIRDVYSDTRVTRAETKERLEDLRDEIDILLDTLS
jgi:hypothetical protein